MRSTAGETAARAARIAVVFTADPEDPASWSGTPSGVIRGLRSAGAEVVGVTAAPPPRLGRAATAALALPLAPRAPATEGRSRLRNAYSAAQISPALTAVRGGVASRTLRQAGQLDGVVQIGTGYQLRSMAPIATLEDMTIRQALKFPYAHWAALNTRQVEARIALQSQVYGAAHAICMTSSWAAASAQADYGLEPGRVHVVGVGSNVTIDGRERDWQAPRFLFVGREWERKNGPTLVRAFGRFRAEREDARLDLVGGHPPISEPGVVGHGSLRLGVPEERARVLELFGQATCFVMVSLLEPSAVAYAEAISAGLPVIGTTEGGSGDLIGDAGVLVDPRSEDDILAALRLMADPSRAAAFAACARRRAGLLTWEAAAERLLLALGLRTSAPPLVTVRPDVLRAS